MGQGSDASRRRFLHVYLNDHLAGSVVGASLARRCLRNNEGTALGAFLEKLTSDIREDKAVLEDLMANLDISPSRTKMLGAAAAERLGRLKLNGRLVGYSELSRLVELEGLYGGVDVKLRLWRTLRHIGHTDERIAALDLDRLVERATTQLEQLESHRQDAATRAFA